LNGIVKMKAAALLLGPTGVGLIGLYINVMQTAASVSALGLGNVGTRQIALAQAESSPAALGKVRRALFWLTIKARNEHQVVAIAKIDVRQDLLRRGKAKRIPGLWPLRLQTHQISRSVAGSQSRLSCRTLRRLN